MNIRQFQLQLGFVSHNKYICYICFLVVYTCLCKYRECVVKTACKLCLVQQIHFEICTSYSVQFLDDNELLIKRKHLLKSIIILERKTSTESVRHLLSHKYGYQGSQVALVVKNLPVQEAPRGRFDSCPWMRNGNQLSILARKMPWTEEPGQLQSGGLKESNMTAQTDRQTISLLILGQCDLFK